MSFTASFPRFSGPMPLLLELVLREEMPITEVSLAKITGDFLVFVETQNIDTDELADFLVVATQLIVIKSRLLLPEPTFEEAEETGSLEQQLKLYKVYADATVYIETFLKKNRAMFEREGVSLVLPSVFSPPAGVTSETLRDFFLRLLKRLEPFFALKTASLTRLFTVQERMQQIKKALSVRSQMSFDDLLSDTRSKSEIVLNFLALLELVKQRTIRVSQSDSGVIQLLPM